MRTHSLDASLNNMVPVRIVNQSEDVAMKLRYELGEIFMVDTCDGGLYYSTTKSRATVKVRVHGMKKYACRPQQQF